MLPCCINCCLPCYCLPMESNQKKKKQYAFIPMDIYLKYFKPFQKSMISSRIFLKTNVIELMGYFDGYRTNPSGTISGSLKNGEIVR